MNGHIHGPQESPMQTFTPGNGLEEHVSTAVDHGEDRRKNVQDIEREQCESMRRVAWRPARRPTSCAC
jgi:hypothetical protein